MFHYTNRSMNLIPLVSNKAINRSTIFKFQNTKIEAWNLKRNFNLDSTTATAKTVIRTMLKKQSHSNTTEVEKLQLGAEKDARFDSWKANQRIFVHTIRSF